MKLSELMDNLFGEDRIAGVLSLFTPPQAQDRSPVVRALLAGGGVLVFGVGLLTAATSAALLLLSIGVVYYLMTQLLGVRLDLDFDPQVLAQFARRQQRAPSAPN